MKVETIAKRRDEERGIVFEYINDSVMAEVTAVTNEELRSLLRVYTDWLIGKGMLFTSEKTEEIIRKFEKGI